MTDTYSPTHVRAILRGLDIKIFGETYNDFLCLCPFHGNRHTPSFSVSHTKGLYLCFNPSCDASGTILELVKEISHRNDYEALRFIQSCRQESEQSFDDELASILEDKPEFEAFPQDKLDEMHSSILTNHIAQQYLSDRGITMDSIEHFKLGYSDRQSMIIVPVHSPDGLPVGLVGRGIYEKTFKNSRNLPRSKTLFNLHRAKRHGGRVIVCESSFDAIRIHQAGYPNVVATLGGYISKENLANLDRYFNSIVIMTDFDDKHGHIASNCRKCYPDVCGGHNPGRDLGITIANALGRKEVLWAMHDRSIVYPHGAKDAGDLTDAEIAHCIRNAVDHVEYSSRNVY